MSVETKCVLSTKDLGRGKPLFSWDPTASQLAVYGCNDKVRIVSTEGKILNTFPLVGVVKLAWEGTRSVLGLIQEKKSSVTLYTTGKMGLDTIDAGIQELCFMAWSPTGAKLALGNSKGNFVLMDSETLKKVPIVGTHTGRIIDGKWTRNNHLVMVGEDNVLSVSDADGILQQQVSLSSTPTSLFLLEFSKTKEEQLISVAFGLLALDMSLNVYNLTTLKPLVMPFEKKLGSITAYEPFLNGLLCVGFSSGFIAVVSMTFSRLKVLSVSQLFTSEVRDLSCSPVSGMCAVIGDNSVKFFSPGERKITELKGSSVKLEEAALDSVRKVQWNKDGSGVAVSTDDGQLWNCTLKVCAVSCAHGSSVLTLVSSRKVLARRIDDGHILYTAEIGIEPTMMAVCNCILAACARNKVMYYTVEKNVATELNTVEYPSNVSALRVSSRHAAVLYDGKVQLHEIHAGGNSITLPESGVANIISVAMSEALLIYARPDQICVINLHDYNCVVKHTPSTGVKKAFPNPSCTRVALIDKNDVLYIFNPVTLVSTQTEGFMKDHKNIMWDQNDYGVFVSYNDRKMATYVYAPHSRYGPTSESIVAKETNTQNIITSIPTRYTPVSLFKGVVTFQASSGSLDKATLRSHDQATSCVPSSDAFYTNFSLNHLRWALQNITTPQEAEDLAVKALHMLDIELAIRLYRQLLQPSLVMYLEGIRHLNEKNILIGHISMIMGFFKDAQNFFMRSSQPLCALQMRHDLMQWEPALVLAKQLAPEKVPILCKEYAQQLEYHGEYVKALEMYKGGERLKPKGHASTELNAAQQEVKDHNFICLRGAARCLLRTGSVREGMNLALASNSTSLMLECAEILESIRQYEDAANLYEKASDFERAATLYILEAKNLKAASRVIPMITSRNIIGMFARGKENEGAFKEAEKAYTQAEDWDNVVRVKVEKLNDLHGAYLIVRQTRSAAAAAIVANMCKKRNEFGSAVEFFVLAKSFQEAFELAKEKNCMSTLESALLNQVQLIDGVAPTPNQSEFAAIAQYYEQNNKPGQAGLFYHISGNFQLALRNYLESGEPEDVEKAIQVVGRSRSDSLTNKLIDYLMGETDGEPKEPSYIFRLYIALGSFEKAAKTSVLIATKEQEIGRYIPAHKTLVEACKVLMERKLHIPNDLRRTLMLLHSYIIVKHLIKPMGDDATASRMLLRVVRNIQKFPQHISIIYSSTALQCMKSGFKKSAFENACAVIQNEKYRTELDDKNRKKIEGIVRKRGKEEMDDPPEGTSPCPFCDTQLPETELDCAACKNTLPFCIITGKHMVKDNTTECPMCHFPALYSSFMVFLRYSQECPMCESTIDINKVQKQNDPDMKAYLA